MGNHTWECLTIVIPGITWRTCRFHSFICFRRLLREQRVFRSLQHKGRADPLLGFELLTCLQRAPSLGDGTHLHLLFFLLTVFHQRNIWCLEEGVCLYNLHRSTIMCQWQPTYVKAYEGLLHN